MKTYQRMALILGAALLQAVYYVQPATGQNLAASEQLTNMRPASISPATAEVTRLAQSGISDEAVIAFVKRSQARFELTEETITYLKDLGLAPQVIAAMIEHDGGSPATSAQLAASVEPASTPNTDNAALPDNGQAVYETDAPADVNYFYTQLSPYGT